MTTFNTSVAVAVIALAMPMASISSSNAMPISSAGFSAGSTAANGFNANAVTQVRGFRGGGFRGYRGGGFRGGRGFGIGAGLLLGGAFAAAAVNNGYYGPGYGYGYAPGYAYQPDYYAQEDVEPGYAGGDAVAYCSQRYRSYNPNTGTYRGYDGNNYACP